MVRSLLIAFAVLLTVGANAQTSSERAAVRLTATVQPATPSITLNWVSIGSTTSLTIYRKLKSGTSWGTAVATPSASSTSWTDNNVTVGTNYEYRVVRVSGGVTGNGYINTGINVAPVDYRGKLILVVDNTLATPLAPEITQLMTDLRTDGWHVIRADVARTASVTSVKAIIQGHYNSDPTNVKAVYLLGHVPVPYSGNVYPDGHDDARGARPADGYYGDMDGTQHRAIGLFEDRLQVFERQIDQTFGRFFFVSRCGWSLSRGRDCREKSGKSDDRERYPR